MTRTLVLLTDGFGGIGGIAEYNRALLRSLCALSEDMEVVALPRVIPLPITDTLPERLQFLREASGSKLRYCKVVLQTLCTNRHFDYIICGHLNLLPLALLAKGLSRAPVLQILHGIEAWTPPKGLLTMHSVRRLDAIAAVSTLTLERFCKWAFPCEPRPQSFLLPGCVDLKKFTPGPANIELPRALGLEGKQVLLTVARLSSEERYKGVDEVLEAVAQLAEELPHLSYVVAGDGTDRLRLIEKARQLGVSDRVRFVGYVPEARKLDYYRMANAFVLPGRKEGLGIVYLEALACGIPAMGSILDGSREALQEGALGVLVDPNDIEDVKRGIREVLSRPAGEVLEGIGHFSEQRFLERLRAIMETITG